MNPERKIEARLTKGVKALGGMSIKIAPTVAGLPDRLVVLPGGVLILIEVKTETGRLRAVQQVMIERLAALGVPVEVLYGAQAVTEWLGWAEEYIEKASRGPSERLAGPVRAFGPPWSSEATKRAGEIK